MKELEFIKYISKKFKTGKPVIKGIGDDCAILEYTKTKYMLLTCDMIIEGTHFSGRATPFQIGWKAVAVNISDIAAMGGVPRYALVSAGIPRNKGTKFLKGIIKGIETISRKFNILLIGGDTNTSRKIVITPKINIFSAFCPWQVCFMRQNPFQITVKKNFIQSFHPQPVLVTISMDHCFRKPDNFLNRILNTIYRNRLCNVPSYSSSNFYGNILTFTFCTCLKKINILYCLGLTLLCLFKLTYFNYPAILLRTQKPRITSSNPPSPIHIYMAQLGIDAQEKPT